MRFTNVLWSMMVAACVGIICVGAKPFDAQFKMLKIENECTMKVPGATSFVAAREGSAYPYGSTIRTGRRSSVVISFSDGNECRILARTELVVLEDTKNRKMKTLKLAQGKAEINLKPDFHKNNDLKVETPTAICGAIECHFTAEVLSEKGLVTAIFESLQGIIKIDGEGFNVPIMGEGAILMVSGTPDMSEITVKVIQGELKVNVNEGKANPTVVTLPKNSLIRIRRTPVDEKTDKITVTIIMPDGKETTFSYTQPAVHHEGGKPGTGSIITPINDVFSTTTSTTQRRDLELEIPASTPPRRPTPTPVGNT